LAQRTSQSTVLGLLPELGLELGALELENAGGGLNWMPGLLGTITGCFITLAV